MNNNEQKLCKNAFSMPHIMCVAYIVIETFTRKTQFDYTKLVKHINSMGHREIK